MDDGLTLSRSQREEFHTARLIRSATRLFTSFIRYWTPCLQFHFGMLQQTRTMAEWMDVVSCRELDELGQQTDIPSISPPVEIVTSSLEDLINYCQLPTEGPDHEVKQNNMMTLRNRQNMFQEEVDVCTYEQTKPV